MEKKIIEKIEKLPIEKSEKDTLKSLVKGEIRAIKGVVRSAERRDPFGIIEGTWGACALSNLITTTLVDIAMKKGVHKEVKDINDELASFIKEKKLEAIEKLGEILG